MGKRKLLLVEDDALVRRTLRAPWRHTGGGRHALPRRIAASLSGFGGRLMLVLGGGDTEAHHFARVLMRMHPGFRCVEVPRADHEFASKAWRQEVAEATASWITSW